MNLLRALIVAPDKSDRLAIARLLEKRNFECVEADDGLSALRFASFDGIDLIVAEARMPKMDGPQFLDIVVDGAFGPAPPLIMCAANLHEQVWIKKLALPGVTLLARPLTPLAFSEALNAAFPVE